MTDTLNKKTVLLIIELHYHAEILQSIIPLLNQRFDIILLTTEKVWQKTGLGASECLLVQTKSKSESTKQFFQTHRELISQADLVYFNTMERDFRFFLHYNFGCPVIVRIHNAHADFFPWSSIDFQRFSLFKIGFYLFTKVLVQRIWSDRKHFFAGVEGLMLPNSVACQYVQQRRQQNLPNMLSYFLPFCFLKEKSAYSPKDNHQVVFAVTGTVDPKRKNYDELYTALERLKARIKTPVKLMFLAGPQGEGGKNVIERFRKLESATFEFVYSLTYVKTAALEQAMTEVDFLIAPINIETTHKIHREVYGTSKISGIENDIINFQRPALITSAYGLDVNLQKVCERYEGAAGLADILERWVESREYRVKQANFADLEAYRPEVILDGFSNLCSELISRYDR